MSALKHSVFAGLLASLVLFGACASEDADLSLQHEALEQDEHLLSPDGKADAIGTTSTYYQVRHDFRRCAWPFCGGFWIKRANRVETRCADGKYAAECYVTDLDYSALGLTDAEISAHSAAEAISVYRGTFQPASNGTVNYTVLAVSEGWQPADDAAPTGVFYRVDDNQIRCIRAPCPVSYHEAKLNSTLSTAVIGFSGRHSAKIVSALGQEGHVLAAGTNVSTRAGKKLNANQFYLPLKHVAVADDNSCSADSDCTRSSYSHYISSGADCYCALCPTTVVNNDGADQLRNQRRLIDGKAS